MTEIVEFFEIVQPACSLTFGVAPCTATGDPCYNTRGTCGDKANYSATTLSLWFALEGTTGWRTVTGIPGEVFPALQSVTRRATTLNFNGSDSSSSGLGTRGTITATIKDFTYNDALTDPYRDTRGTDPRTNGTFWQRWFPRNPHRVNLVARHYIGAAGQDISEFDVVEMLISTMTHPNGGAVTVSCVDWLSKLSPSEAQAPAASPGTLRNDISSGAGSIAVSNADEDDYPATGTVRIGDELIKYSARSLSGSTLTFTVDDRGAWETTAASASEGDTVQRCIVFEDATVGEVYSELLETWTSIPAAKIDAAALDDEVDRYYGFHKITAILSEPEDVYDLVDELAIQYGLLSFVDERTGLVTFRALRNSVATPPLITAESNIIGDTFAVTYAPKEWLSQVWISYARRTQIADLDEWSSFAEVAIEVDESAEIPEEYDATKIKKIKSRWMRNTAFATGAARRILSRFIEIPTSCTFNMARKDRDTWVGDFIRISHPGYRDKHGARKVHNWFITGVSPQGGGVYKYTARSLETFSPGQLMTEASEADYTPGVSDETLAFMCDADGLLSDGTPGARFF